MLKTLLDQSKFMEDLVGISLFFGTLVEPLFLIGSQFYFNYSFYAVFADYYRYAEADVLLAVFTVLRNAAGDDSLLVVQDGADDACCTGAGCVVCGSTHKFGDCCTAYHGVCYHFLPLLSCEKLLDFAALVEHAAHQWNHCGVTMCSDNHTVNLAHRHVESLAQVVSETAAVQSAAHTDGSK